MSTLIDKDRPAPAWIAGLRRRYTCEPEIDRILTAKLERRARGPYRPVGLETLLEGTRALIASAHPAPFEIREPRWLTGGASKVQMAFTLVTEDAAGQRVVRPLVLRMEPAESLVETSRRREFQVLRAFAGVVPVPAVYWQDAQAEYLPNPALVCGFVDGVTKPADSTSQATGMGTWMAPAWRARLGPQFVEHLAAIHGHRPEAAALEAFEQPAPGTGSVLRALDHWARVWEEDADEDVPLMRLAEAWLRANAPACARPVVLHGDYRVGNFLFTEHDGRITAILDWEMSRIGDHHFDLAYCSNPAYGHYAEDGRTFLVGGFMPESELHARYQAHGGQAIEARSLHYHKVYCAWMQGVIAFATAWRVAHNGKTHQDVVAAWIVGISYKLLDELRRLLEQGA